MHASRRVLAFLSLVTLFAFTAPWAFSQGIVTGSLSGTVVDASGAAVSGATIVATEAQTNRTFNAKTNAQGAYQIPQVPPGIYNLKINAPNFEGVQYQSVQVNVGRDTSTGIAKLKVGGEQQTVTVEGAAPLIESNSIQIQDTFSAKQTADLPIGNGFDQLALFVPGVTSAGDAGFSNNNGAELSVNGQRGRSNNFQIDGQGNNDNSVAGPAFFFGNQDAIAELQVITNYTAEYGRNMGSVVNYVTKSGSNSFHGTGYEYYQGSFLDSLGNESKNPVLGFCAPGQNADTDGCTAVSKPRVVDNRWGGTVGGPILKDKLWFFGSTNWEHFRQAGAPNSSGSNLTFTPQGLQQLAAISPNNPAVTLLQQFGPTAITQGNPTFTNLQNLPLSINGVPVPGGVQVGSVTRFANPISNNKEVSGRVDTQLSNKDRVFGRYLFQEQLFTQVSDVQAAAFASGAFFDEPSRSQAMGLDWTRNWTTTFFDQNRLNFSRSRVTFEGGSFPTCVDASITQCPPQISFNGSNTFDVGGQSVNFGPSLNVGRANNLPQGRIVNTWEYQNNANWQLGRHSFKFGAQYDKQRSPNTFLPNVNGSFRFANLQAFLDNTPNQSSITVGDPSLPFQEHDVAAYFQDDWRIKDNLTLNLGLRWEWFQQAVNLLADRSIARQNSATPLWDPNLPLGLTTVHRIPEDLNNFGPVIGFAWTPRIWQGLFGQEKTVIRGGFRIAYDPAFYNIFLNVASAAPEVNAQVFNGVGKAPGMPTSGNIIGTNVQASLLPLVPTGACGAPCNPGGRSQTNVADNFHNPYSEQWNFGVQRQITNRIAAEVRYVGNHTVGNFMSINANPNIQSIIDAGFPQLVPAGVVPCPDATTPGGARGFEDCNHTIVRSRNNGAFGFYHALQSELRIQNWHGLAGNISYTFSKNIDNVSEIFSTFAGGNTVTFAQNPFDTQRGEKALSGIDYPHALAVSLVYNLPFANAQTGLLSKLVGGWQWNATYRYLSGQPYTVSQFLESGVCDNAGLGGGADLCRPFLSNPSAPLNSFGFCDPSQFGLDAFDPGVSCVDANFNPINPSSVHWINNSPASAQVLGLTPFNGARRNLSRGDSTNAVNMSVFKNTKINERVNLRLELTAFNVFNIQYRGTPDPFLEDGFGNCPNGGQFVGPVCSTNPSIQTSFGNTRFNPNGNFQANANQSGIGIRRVQLGAKFIF